MSAQSYCRHISEMCEYFLIKSYAFNIQSHAVKNVARRVKKLTYIRPASSVAIRSHENEIHLSEYLGALRNREYSILMNDGALLQISIDFEGADIAGHRFAYLPCPIDLKPEDLIDEQGSLYPVEDYINDLSQFDFRQLLRIRAPLRFEFDPKNSKEDHPASHLHLGKSNCRITVKSPMPWKKFIKLIIKQFYPDIYSVDYRKFQTKKCKYKTTITRSEVEDFHIIP